ncbi:MAG: 16S rRNA processing protein RimM [Rhodospirillales bacterium CG15_BIG_FIL_POST_REV_8_21_14_020_66_15]|nr:MAG: 16S rRNA processing protein RimM [Rhodospirillales bacterium CG15_BIG_FIL_POST_REV_8_21_14_020_66_15]
MTGGEGETRERVCLGVIVGTRGLKGDLKVKSFAQVPEDIAAYGTLEDESGNRRIELRVTGQAKGVLIARADGVDDRTAADKLKGLRLYVGRDRLPPPDEDEYYHSDLIGLAAEAPQGGLGTVRQVYDFGAGDVLEIAGGEFGTVMVPFTRACVPVVDLAGGRLVVDPPDGLLEMGGGANGQEEDGRDDQ